MWRVIRLWFIQSSMIFLNQIQNQKSIWTDSGFVIVFNFHVSFFIWIADHYTGNDHMDFYIRII